MKRMQNSETVYKNIVKTLTAFVKEDKLDLEEAASMLDDLQHELSLKEVKRKVKGKKGAEDMVDVDALQEDFTEIIVEKHEKDTAFAIQALGLFFADLET